MAEWVTVAKTSELQPGQQRIVDIDGASIAVFNLNGKYFAIENVCTHDGGVLTGGCVEGDQIICPRHGARFSIPTGEALTAPAYEPIATFPLRIKDEEIQIQDNRWD
jgi:3-phenylpropionate/trans-cinnamate dioxygenase ferredoxin subunit